MRSRNLFMGAAVALFAAARADAQTPTGTLVVSLTGASAEAVQHIITLTTADATSRHVRTDSAAGKSPTTLSGVGVGRYRVETRALGYVPDTSFIEIFDGRTARLTIDLRRVTALDPVTIAGTSKGHMAAFEKRRAAGKGTFLTKDDLTKTRRSQVSEVLRTIRGLRVDCGSGCKVHMVRSTTCEPRYYLNGFPTDASVLQTPVLDVAGIEIYRGPSETPGEFLSAQSMCGAIVIWTQ